MNTSKLRQDTDAPQDSRHVGGLSHAADARRLCAKQGVRGVVCADIGAG